MILSFQVLSGAGRNNTLLVRVASGQPVSRLLIDCGDGCLWDLPFGEVQTFFRCTYNRTAQPNHV